MSRIDKSDPMTSSYRSDIAADFPDVGLGKLYGWGHDSTGKAVVGVGVTGIRGVWVINQKPGRVGPLKEIPRIDIMRQGCVTDFQPTAGTPGTDVGVASTNYYSDVLGNISATPGVGSYYVGTTIEPDRLEVNIVPIPLVAGQDAIATVSARANSTAYTVGQYITSSGTVLECTTAGTSAGSAPTAPSAIGGTVTDGTAVFTRVQ